MPLITMTSDLSWYGNTPPGFQPNTNKQSTDFKYNQTDLTVMTRANGFNELGNPVTFANPLISLDAFPIDTALGENGNAKRKAQRGAGSLFPIGPNGQVHQFDTKRTGWYNTNRYGDQFNNKTLTGLANTYTAKSPIDDMYNKFKVRDEVYDPYGYANTPYILRGIQRDDSSDPQRWGLSGTTGGTVSGLLDIPRGGPLVAGERIGLDVLRLGKFLIRPKGLAFIVKQQLLRLMSPNVEGIEGNVYKLNPQKIYNPVNTLLSAAGSAIGLRFRNYGLLPIGGLSRYEDIHTARTVAQLEVKNNRLNKLNNQRELIGFPGIWTAISGFTGPDSVGGVGFTNITKYESYDTHRWFGRFIEVINKELIPQYDIEEPYISTRSGKTAQSPGPGNPSRPQLFIDSRENRGGSILSPYQKTSLIKQLYNARLRLYPESFREKLLKDQLNFHNDNISGYGNLREINGRTTNYLNPYIGYRNQRNVNITNDTKTLTEDSPDGEYRLKKSLRVTLDNADNDTNFTGTNLSPNPAKAVDNTPPIAKYKTLSYGQIPKERNGSKEVLDFKTGMRYDIEKIPMAQHLNVNKDKKLYLPENNDHSLIKLTIAGVNFIAYLTSWGENNNGGISAKNDTLGTYPTYMYDSYERTIDCQFIVAARSKAELAKNWSKLKTLQRACQPIGATDSGGTFGGTTSFWKPKLTSITIGDIYKNRTCIMTSCNFSIDVETPWEISDGQQVPYYVSVDIAFTVVSLDGKSFGGFTINPGNITKDIKTPDTRTQADNAITNQTDTNTKAINDTNPESEPQTNTTRNVDEGIQIG